MTVPLGSKSLKMLRMCLSKSLPESGDCHVQSFAAAYSSVSENSERESIKNVATPLSELLLWFQIGSDLFTVELIHNIHPNIFLLDFFWLPSELNCLVQPLKVSRFFCMCNLQQQKADRYAILVSSLENSKGGDNRTHSKLHSRIM